MDSITPRPRRKYVRPRAPKTPKIPKSLDGMNDIEIRLVAAWVFDRREVLDEVGRIDYGYVKRIRQWRAAVLHYALYAFAAAKRFGYVQHGTMRRPVTRIGGRILVPLSMSWAEGTRPRDGKVGTSCVPGCGRHAERVVRFLLEEGFMTRWDPGELGDAPDWNFGETKLYTLVLQPTRAERLPSGKLRGWRVTGTHDERVRALPDEQGTYFYGRAWAGTRDE